jgi:CT1975-like protein
MNGNKLVNRFLVFQWLQTLPVSNPNRDRTGAPKTTYYGGSMRSRISSQSWSRQVREAFNEKWEGDAGSRSRLWADRLAQKLQERLEYDRTDSLIVSYLILAATGAKADKVETFKAGQTDVLMFLSNNELQELIEVACHYQPQLDEALTQLRPNAIKALAEGKVPSLTGESKGKGKGKNKAKKESDDSAQEQPDLSALKKLNERVVAILKNNRSAADICPFAHCEKEKKIKSYGV